MHERPRQLGLTSIELMFALGILVLLVWLALTYWQRAQRARWEADLAADPGLVFRLECEPLKPTFDGVEQLGFLCEITNTAPFPIEFQWRIPSFVHADATAWYREHQASYLRWAVVRTRDEIPATHATGGYAPIIFPDSPVLLRLEAPSPYRGPTALPKFGDGIEVNGRIRLGKVDSGPLRFMVHPPVRPGMDE